MDARAATRLIDALDLPETPSERDSLAPCDHASGLRPDGSLTATSPVTSGSIIFRPGVVSTGNAVATWAEIQKAIAATTGALTVLVDDSTAAAIVPASGTMVTNCKGAVTIAPYNAKIITPTQLEVADTAQLLNLAAVEGTIVLLCDSVTVSSLNFSYSTPSAFEFGSGATIRLKAGASIAPIVVPNGEEFYLASSDGATFDNSASSTVPIVSLLGTAQFVHYAIGGFTFGAAPVTGGGSSSWIISHDNTVSTPPLGLFTGTFTETRLSLAVQTLPSQGVSTGRPANPKIGQSYFDTTVGSTLWWSGTAWIASLAGPRRAFTATDVYINALTGNDLNDGLSPGTAWATNEALRAAIGVFGLIAPGGVGGIQRWFTVHYQGAMPVDFQNLQFTLDANACFRAVGTDLVTTLHTGTISSVVQFTNANTRASITDAGVADWTPYVGKRIRWLTGAAAGAVAYVSKDLGGGAAGISYPGILFDVVATHDGVPTSVQPSTGTYVIEDLPICYLGNFQVGTNPNGAGIEPFCVWNDLYLKATPGSSESNPEPIGLAVNFIVQGCICEWIEPRGPIEILFSACCFPYAFLPAIDGNCAEYNSLHLNAWGYISGSQGLVVNCVGQGCGLAVLQWSEVELNGIAVYDAVASYPNAYGDGVSTVAPSTPPGRIVSWGQSFFSGSNNAGVGIRVSEGETSMIYYRLPTITGNGVGGGSDFAIGLSVTAAAYNASTGVYTTPTIPCTWANMAVAVTGGGFAEATASQYAGAHQPGRDGHLLLVNP